MIVCDNATGDPVDMDLGPAAAQVTVGIAAVNAETATMLRSYAEHPQSGGSCLLHTEGCPFSLETSTSQV